MAPASTWRMLPSCSHRFNDSTPPASFQAPALGSRAWHGLYTSMAAAFGPMPKQARAPRSSSPFQTSRTLKRIRASSQMKGAQMTTKPILLVEDTPDDAELTVMSLKQSGLLNDVVVAEDGLQALDYLFG